MKNIVHNLDTHPILGFLCSLIMVIVGHGLQLLHASLQIDPVHLPPIIIEIMQCLAYAGAGVTGAVSAHGWLVKRKESKKTGKKK